MTNRLPADTNASGSKDAQEHATDVLLAQGDDSAFEQLVKNYQSYVSVLVYRLLGWSPDVEDTVQEVFLAAFNNLRKFRGQSGVKTWLTMIAVNKSKTLAVQTVPWRAVAPEGPGGGAQQRRPPGTRAGRPRSAGRRVSQGAAARCDGTALPPGAVYGPGRRRAGHIAGRCGSPPSSRKGKAQAGSFGTCEGLKA